MGDWLREHLVCPLDRSSLVEHGAGWRCGSEHFFPSIEGIPVFLLDGDVPSHAAHFARTRELVSGSQVFEEAGPPFSNEVHPFVQREIIATCGILYKNLRGRLARYPIPRFRLREGKGRRLLDIGCNWGRWCVSASRVGFLPVGIDPSLEGVLAARRVAKQLEAEAEFLVGDGRRLPFADESFDVVFSYSVLQHFDKGEAGKVLGEIHRVLKPGGTSLVQMLNLYGLRSQYHLFRRGFRAPTGFEVRYWTPRKLKETFESLIGPTRCIVDGFFSANAQRSDVDMLSFPHRCVVYVSELLRALSRRLFPLRFLADSLYLESRKGDGGSHGTVVGRCGDEQARKTGNDFSGGGTAS